MKYIVKKLVDLIVNNVPEKDSEMMIRVNSFEDLRIYEALARNISKELADMKLSYKIKLAKNKWRYFQNIQEDSSCLQSMEQNDWIADEESITHYRNMHDTNVLILLGTENEEDQGGLMNCYTITPDVLVKELGGNYYDVFDDVLEFNQNEVECVNKLYKDLFEYIPIDICKLSNIVDCWTNRIEIIDDFIELFYVTLPLWGLPFKKLKLPTVNEVKVKRNILKTEHDFISRQMFKKFSKTQYNKYKLQLETYEEEKHEYSSLWTGWLEQEIDNYQDFSNIVIGYACGEKVKEYKEKLLKTDFSIIEDVFDIKIDKRRKEKKTIPVVYGEPLEAFMDALLQMLCIAKESGVEVARFNFIISQAEIVSMYSDSEGEEEIQQLQNTWLTICRHTNGVLNYFNKKEWYVGDESISILCSPKNIFATRSVLDNIDKGYIKAASSNKTISKIDFNIRCEDSEGNVIKVGSKKLEQEFQWKFSGTDSWLHNFSDICLLDEFVCPENSYIPIAIIDKLTALLFAKSEEEFFDLYDESDIRFDFSLVKYVRDNTTSDTRAFSNDFVNLGKKFAKFIYLVTNEGFYAIISKESSELNDLVDEYAKLGEKLSKSSLPENQKWLLDVFIHAFNIEENIKVITDDTQARCCIVPSWHPAALEKLHEQKQFFLNGCAEWWEEQRQKEKVSKKNIQEIIENLLQMSKIQSGVDIFPTSGQRYFGVVNSFEAFSVYGRDDIENNSRLKDMIHKDAIYDDDFDSKENAKMNDNAKMLYGVMMDYTKAFPDSYMNLSLVYIDPAELQPIIASIYQYIDRIKKTHPNKKINICIKILVKPENKGGRNYLAYWMDECFSQDANVSIRTYLNEWKTKSDIDKLLNGNNDIVFVMDLLKVNNLQFVKESGVMRLGKSQCKFPIVYKPSPVSDTNIKRRIELSQPQFRSAYAHTQVSRYRNVSEIIPDGNFIAVKEVYINKDAQDIVYGLHEKAYWVVCVDNGMDGALLKKSGQYDNEYPIIGFSTGKGANGQYNLTITARKPILKTIQRKLESRLYQLFHWERLKINKAAELCLNEASGLDGISLLSAINQKDYNINEFMAYVLTSFREKEKGIQSALKIVVHLDSYKHWFSDEIEKEDNNLKSRPDFLVLEVKMIEDEKLQLNATVTECKMSSITNASQHKEKAMRQVKHGIEKLSNIFNPESTSIKRRYWYAQLYRALAFAQVTFSDDSTEFAELSSKLRAVLDGNFDINWNGQVLGYWLDMEGDMENVIETEISNIKIYDIPQKRIQQLLLNEGIDAMQYVDVDEEVFVDKESLTKQIAEREKEIREELKEMEKKKKQKIRLVDEEIKNNGIKENKVGEIKEVREEDGGEKKENKPKTVIQVNDVNEVYLSKNNTKQNALEDTRVLVGSDKISDKVYWEFGHKQLANRHLLITGTSGQGKTYSIQTMLYELSKSNVSSVIFDYTEGFRLDQLEGEFKKRMENHINQRIVKFENVPINPFKRQFIEFAGSRFPEKDSDIAARFSNIMTHVYKFGDQQAAAIFDAVRNGLTKYKDEMNMKRFQEELESTKQMNRAAQTVISKMQPFFYSIEFEEKSDFDWKDVIYPEESTATIFQLTSIDRDMQVIITELMLWDLWYYSTKNGNKEKPFVVVLDEAQNLSHKDKSPSCKILTEGRKFGWSAWYATQSLKVLDDDEVNRLLNSAFRLYFKPTDDEIVKMAKQLDPTDGSNWMSALKGLKKGQCIVVGERVRKDGKFGLVKPTITSVIAFEERH